MGSFDETFKRFLYGKNDSAFALIELALGMDTESESFVLPKVTYEYLYQDQGTALTHTSLRYMEGSADNGAILYHIPKAGGQTAKEKHQRLKDAGCVPLLVPHTGPKRATAHVYPTHTSAGADKAINSFLGGDRPVLAIQKKHLMKDTTNSLVLQFHTPYDLEYVKMLF